MLRFVHINQDLQMELSIAELGCDIKRFNAVGGGWGIYHIHGIILEQQILTAVKELYR